MEKDKFDEIADSIEKIQESTWISNEKKSVIEEKEKKLREETRIVIAEEQKNEIAKLNDEKKEFDSITIEALINTKVEIIKEKEKLNKEFNQKLLDAQKERKNIEKKLEVMLQKDSEKVSVEKIKEAAEKAKQKVDKDLINFENSYTKKIEDLNRWDNKIDEFANSLDAIEEVEDEVSKRLANKDAEQAQNDNNDQEPEQNDNDDQEPEQNDNDDQEPEQNDNDDQEPEQNDNDDQEPEQNDNDDQEPEQNDNDDQEPEQNDNDDQEPEQNDNDDQEPEQNDNDDQEPEQNDNDDQEPVQNDNDDQEPEQNDNDNQETEQNDDRDENESALNMNVPNLDKKYTVTIGSSVKINSYKNGIETSHLKINPEVYKNGAELNTAYYKTDLNLAIFMDLLKNKQYSNENIRLITECYMNRAPIDFTVINSINETGKDSNDINILIKGYLINTLKSHYEYNKTRNARISRNLEKYKDVEPNNNLEIVYNMKDLSKPLPFWRVLFSRHPENTFLTGKEKEKIARLANFATAYGIGKTEGKYEYNNKSFFAKFLARYQKNWILLPEPDKMKTIDKVKPNSNVRDAVVEENTPVPRANNEEENNRPEDFLRGYTAEPETEQDSNGENNPEDYLRDYTAQPETDRNNGEPR